MIQQEYVKQKLKDLEVASPVDVCKHSLAILETHLILEKAEQEQFSEILEQWAARQPEQKELLQVYIRLMRAYFLFYKEDYDAALPQLVETQKLFSAQNDTGGAAICTVLQGSIYRTIGNTDLALQSFWWGHQELSSTPLYRHFLLACDVNLAGIYVDAKNYDEAIPIFRNALAMAEDCQKYYWLIYALHGLGKVYLAQQKYEDALAAFEKAMAVSVKFNNPVSTSNSLTELGNFHFTRGSYKEAEQFHRQALAMREENRLLNGAITNCIRLGEIFIRDSRPDEARAILDKGLKMAEQLRIRPKMYQIHFLLSTIFDSLNDATASLYHYKLFHELREQVEAEASTRRVKNAQLVFEAEQTKKENIVIKRQKEEIEKKNIELQETVDKLTRARIGKKARAITLGIAIILFIMEDTILHFALTVVNTNNYFISMVVKIVIIFSLSPINKAIEGYLLKRVMEKKRAVLL